MAVDDGTGHALPSWFVAPDNADILAWVSLAILALALYGIVTLYAAFDRWAEHKSKGTPLAKTIPTLLAIALLYEIFPLGHFNVLLPLSAILIALMADWSRFHALGSDHIEHETDVLIVTSGPPSPGGDGPNEAQEIKNA
ncbi:hypothetical protein [Roseovarius sp. M141]|uniref:hypothetical protein n=1 Tax=Roseovarius sp. M141 TaxID=2583806 RepID=UPI0020CF92C4|nr:hypothetical protein [Roseovarius sp. M141]